jgi:hypothetical protein
VTLNSFEQPAGYSQPVAIVEHVTSSQVLIKAAIIQYDFGIDPAVTELFEPVFGNDIRPALQFRYTPVPFSFVAVGPMA